MPDFTYHLTQQCGQIGRRTVLQVPSSTINTTYTVTVKDGQAECTCPGHKFHGHCKHAAAAQERCCQWHLDHGTAQTLQQNVDMVCPDCGQPTELVRAAA